MARPSKRELEERGKPEPPLHDRLVEIDRQAKRRGLVLHAAGDRWVLVVPGTADRMAAPAVLGDVDDLEDWLSNG